MERITKSTAEIESVEIPNWYSYRVGEYGITQIIPYDENGEMVHVPWIAITRGNEVWKRIPARLVVITYKPNSADDDAPF